MQGIATIFYYTNLDFSNNKAKIGIDQSKVMGLLG